MQSLTTGIEIREGGFLTAPKPPAGQEAYGEVKGHWQAVEHDKQQHIVSVEQKRNNEKSDPDYFFLKLYLLLKTEICNVFNYNICIISMYMCFQTPVPVPCLCLGMLSILEMPDESRIFLLQQHTPFETAEMDGLQSKLSGTQWPQFGLIFVLKLQGSI